MLLLSIVMLAIMTCARRSLLRTAMGVEGTEVLPSPPAHSPSHALMRCPALRDALPRNVHRSAVASRLHCTAAPDPPSSSTPASHLGSRLPLFIQASLSRVRSRGRVRPQVRIPDVDFSRIVVDVQEGTSKFFGSSFGGGLSPKVGGGAGYTEFRPGGGGGSGTVALQDAVGAREDGGRLVDGGDDGAGGSSSVVRGLKSMGYGGL